MVRASGNEVFALLNETGTGQCPVSLIGVVRQLRFVSAESAAGMAADNPKARSTNVRDVGILVDLNGQQNRSFGILRHGLLPCIPAQLYGPERDRQATIAISRRATPANLKAVRTRREMAAFSDSLIFSEISPPELRIRFLNTRRSNSGILTMPAGSITIHKPM